MTLYWVLMASILSIVVAVKYIKYALSAHRKPKTKEEQ